MSLIRELLCTATLLLIVAIFGRIILSWFPLQPGGAGAKAFELMSRITDPILDPVRRVLPRTGLLDLSPLVVTLVLQIVVRGLILGC
jgi:YggT family protein